MSRARTAIWAFLLLLTGAMPAYAGDRVALVIGNGSYQHAPLLANPSNDASDISVALERLSFKVTLLINGSYDGTRRALIDFGRRAQGAEIAIIYFAGHGIQIGGENWLIPIDAQLETDINVANEAISLQSMARAVSNTSKLGLVILDACRTNPFIPKMRSTNMSRAVDRGFSRVEPSDNVLIAYAARDGTTAQDGMGRNSPFTRSLLNNIETPGLEIRFLFATVRDEVMASTNREQQPYIYGSLSKEMVYLMGLSGSTSNVSPVGPPPAPPTTAMLPSANQPSSSAAVTPKAPLHATAVAEVQAKYRDWTVTSQQRDEQKYWAVAISRDGKLIASGGNDKSVKIWNAENGSLIQTLKGHTDRVWAIAISPDGKFIVSGSNDKSIKIWDASTGTLIRTLQGHTESVLSLAISSDSKWILSSSGERDNSIKIWDASSGILTRTIRGHTNTVRAIAFSPDGRWIVSGSYDTSIKIWAMADGRLLRTLKGNKGSVFDLAISSDGRWIVSANGAGAIQVWNAITGSLERTLDSDHVQAVAITPDSGQIISGEDYKPVKLWNLASGVLVRSLQVAGRPIAIYPDGSKFVVANSDALAGFDLASGDVLWSSLSWEDKFVTRRPDGSFIAEQNMLAHLRLAKGSESIPLPDDYKAVFWRRPGRKEQ
ncbi:caspase family protein [Bradyrhizobium cenepequi]